MADLQFRNMPDALHERLRRYARESNCSMREAVLNAIEKELARWEWERNLAQRPETDFGADAATILKEERTRREGEIE